MLDTNLTGLQNAVEIDKEVFTDVMIARVDEEDDVDDAKQRQQHNSRSYCFPNNNQGNKYHKTTLSSVSQKFTAPKQLKIILLINTVKFRNGSFLFSR